MKALALILRFLLELAALFALLFGGQAIVDGAGGWLLGTLASAAAAVAWGMFVAPRARIKVADPIRLAVELAVFAAAVLALLLAGWVVLAAVLAGLYVLHRVLLWAAGGPLFEPPDQLPIARKTTR